MHSIIQNPFEKQKLTTPSEKLNYASFLCAFWMSSVVALIIGDFQRLRTDIYVRPMGDQTKKKRLTMLKFDCNICNLFDFILRSK